MGFGGGPLQVLGRSQDPDRLFQLAVLTWPGLNLLDLSDLVQGPVDLPAALEFSRTQSLQFGRKLAGSLPRRGVSRKQPGLGRSGEAVQDLQVS